MNRPGATPKPTYADGPAATAAAPLCAALAHYGPAEASGLIRQGLPFACMTDMQRLAGLSEERLGRLIGIPRSTLLRRKKDGALSPEEGDRAWRLLRVMSRALDLFAGDQEAARAWMTTPKAVFSGRTPLEFADTTPGAEFVLDVIGRLEHGIPV